MKLPPPDHGNGVTLANGFDLDGRLAAIDSHIGAAGIVVRDYAFDLAGNITGVADNAGTMSWDYGYDALYRLVHGDHILVGGVTDEESYSYDAVGNRTERIVTKGRFAVTDTLAYDAASNRLESVSVFTPRVGKIKPSTVVRTLGYSDSGNTATDDKGDGTAWTLDYDSSDRLISVANSGGTVLGEYLHNALGQRVSKTAGKDTTHYLYDLSGNLIAEADVPRRKAASVTAEYVALEEMLLAFITTGGIYSIHVDHLGTPQVLTDGAGAVAWSATYSPFGLVLEETGLPGFNLRFPGQYHDRETGYYYNWYRTYDPTSGRYLESDPIGLDGGWNTYAYVWGNPLKYMDIFGLYAELCSRQFYPVMILVAKHCYIRFNGDTNDTLSFDPTGVNDDPAPDWWLDNSCQPTQGDENDDCVRREMARCEADDFDFIAFNCCNCAERAMRNCGLRIPREDWPNWPINPGPGPGEQGWTPPDPLYPQTPIPNIVEFD